MAYCRGYGVFYFLFIIFSFFSFFPRPTSLSQSMYGFRTQFFFVKPYRFECRQFTLYRRSSQTVKLIDPTWGLSVDEDQRKSLRLVEFSHICREGDRYGKQFRLSHEAGRTVRPALNPPRKLTTRLESEVLLPIHQQHFLQTLLPSNFIRVVIRGLLLQPSAV